MAAAEAIEVEQVSLDSFADPKITELWEVGVGMNPLPPGLD